MRTLVIGSTGFTGPFITRALLERGFEVACFARPSSHVDVLPAEVPILRGTLQDTDSVLRAMGSMDALVHLTNLMLSDIPGVLRAAKTAGVKRVVFISTTAMFTTIRASSKAQRARIEAAIESSGLNYTILRPTMIYGTSRDRNMSRLVHYLRRWPVIPVIGRGESLQQPVYVSDVAAAVASVLRNDAACRKSYNICGAQPLTFNEVIRLICELLRKRVATIRVPVRGTVAALRLLERLPVRLPLRSEQVLRLNEDKAFDNGPAVREFGYDPMSFAEGIRLELSEMGLLA